MVKSEALSDVFHALGDPTRRQMLLDLAQGERTVGELAEPFAMSLAAASKHIKVLESAGLLRRGIRWRTHVCRLEPGPLARPRSGSPSTSNTGPTAWTCSKNSSESTARRTTEMIDLATVGAYGVLVEPATLRIQRRLPGPIERVWAFLTESDQRRLGSPPAR